MTPELEFSGKVALVVGGARGIGLAIARQFAREGARVFIADINRENGERAHALLTGMGAAAEFVQVDLTRPGDAASMVGAVVQAGGRIDMLVNNARAGRRLELLEETEANWDLTTGVGIKSVFFASQAAIRAMGAGGSIVNVGSVASVLATNESPSYHAMKGGLVQLTRYLAVAAGPRGIRVNAVLPGLIVQEDHRARFDAADNEQYREIAALYQPMGDVGSEVDVAQAATFLCSAKAKYISGASLVIDGGATVQEQFGLLLRRAGP